MKAEIDETLFRRIVVRRLHTIDIMKITKRLEMIDKLITNRAAPAKIRGHILAIREQLETYEEEAQKVAAYKEQIADLEAENAKLKTPTVPRWGSQPRIKGRMER